MAQFSAEQQKRFAWKKVYDTKEELDGKKNDCRLMVSVAHNAWAHGFCDERMLWAYADINGLFTKVYSQFICGKKTHKGTATRTKNEDGLRVEETYDAHITAEGTPYKPWKDGDVPSFYIKAYPITQEHFYLTENGVFALKHEHLKKMDGKTQHKHGVLAWMDSFGHANGLIPDDAEHTFVNGDYAVINKKTKAVITRKKGTALMEAIEWV